jgi:hypothetical protein
MRGPFTSGRPGRFTLLAAVLAVVSLLAPPPTLSTPQALGAEGWQGGQYTDASRPAARPGAGVVLRATDGPITLADTSVQRPRLLPGDSAALRANYEVADTTEVRETRVIRYDGLVLARVQRVISRPRGGVASEYRVKVPADAAEGWYAVTTTLEPVRPATRGGGAEQQKETAFYVETAGAKAPATAAPAAPAPASPAPPSPGPAAAPATPSDPEAISVKLSANQRQFKVGDKVTLSFTTNRDAYVTLVNVGTSGEVTILFPNRFSGSHGVKAGQTYSVPEATDGYEFIINGPPGVELVYALVTPKPVVFLPTDFPSGKVFQSVTEQAPAFTRDINVAAKAIPLREQAKATLELTVSP